MSQPSPPLRLAAVQQQPAGLGLAAKRKKWTEEEERSLIDKYAEMQREGTLARMKTREKKFRPIAAHVNASHHALDSASFPFQWSWKDASTKVQNMRHQYLLVKQKLLSSAAAAAAGSDQADFPWDDGLSHWPNFLRYRDVFGDVPLPSSAPSRSCFEEEEEVRSLGLGLGFDCEPDEVEEEGFDYDEVDAQPLLPAPFPPPPLPAAPPLLRKKRRKKTEAKAWAFVEAQIARLKEMEARLEERDAEQDAERKRREELCRAESEARERVLQQMRRDLEDDWRDRRRRQQEEEREWGERAERRRLAWKKNVEAMLNQHRIEMDQLQARVLHVQQTMVAQIVGLVAQWSVPNPQSGGALPDAGGFPNHHHHHHHQQAYVSQMMQNLHHLNGIVHADNRVDGESQDDQFIVDDA